MVEESFDTLKNIIHQIMKLYKGAFTWVTKNDLELKDKTGKVEGKIKLDNLKVDVSGVKIKKLYKELKDTYTNSEKNKLTDAVLNKGPLKDITTNRNKYGEIENNPVVAKLLIKELTKRGIKCVKVETQITQKDTVFSDLTLGFSVYTTESHTTESIESGYFSRLKTFLINEKYCSPTKTKDTLDITQIKKYNNFVGEKTTEIKYKNMLIGHYFPERNFVNINFNPFLISEISVFDTELPELFEIILKVLDVFKVKEQDVSSIQEKIFIDEFMKDAKNKMLNLKNNLKDYKSNISSYEKSIRNSINQYQSDLADITYIENNLKTNGSGLFNEINAAKKLSFIKKITITNGTINMLFKPTFVAIPNMIRHDGGKSYGKRQLWCGEIGFKIKSNEFRVYGNTNMAGHCHPHGSSFPEGGACFGDGDGRRKIYSLLANNKFCDLGKMLWFWIKTYINSGAYVKCWNVYDSLLKSGYPIFDDKGKLVEINDPIRIKSGEQIKLTKEINYKANKDKFGKIKLC